MPRLSAPSFADRSEAVPNDGPGLAALIQARIEARLSGRIRNLSVRIRNEVVVLSGRCATYHTKQLAQHAALGVIEDEQLENEIQVTVPK